MRDLLSENIEKVSTREEACHYLELLSEAIPKLCLESGSIADYISAMSGFLEDYNEVESINKEDYQRLCAIIFESLFYA